ncbi:MAG: DeoR/GlpR transcriptional regulator [Ruminococcus sp.]|nr:DeoR/GlpR transcriptional regulator [Ruminococcus sp.]
MLSQDRYNLIQNIINERNTVTVAELAEALDTSESTIRRDLTALDELGKIKKFFGGATKVKTNDGFFEEAVSAKVNLMSEEKTAIARYSATLINDNDFVYIDAGTTTSRLIDFITNDKATYVTNGITHARKLIHKGLNAYIIGGKIKSLTEAIVGAEGIANLRNFNFSKAFMGVNGIDIEAGFTTPDIEEAMIKEAALKHSYTAFVLADNSKFRRVFPVTFSEIDKCCIITDVLPDKSFYAETIIKEVTK